LRSTRGRIITVVAVGLAIALLITLFSPLASSDPDGLERVAEDEEFINKAADAPYEIIADYAFPWVENEDAATILAGIVGVLIVAAIAFALAFGLQRLGSRSPSASKQTPGASGESPP
jgi:hypothetical protein